MNVVPLVCLFLLTRSGTTSAAGHGVIKVKQDSDVILPCSLDSKENIVAGVFDWKKVAQRDQGQKEVFYYDAGDHYNSGRDGQSPEFRGRVSHFPDQLNQGNASIIIRNTKVEDTGSYTCNFPRLQPPQTFSVELVVDRVLRDRSGDPGAAPKPIITSLNQTKDSSLLQCEAHGNPRPEVEWRNSSGNKLPADEPEFSVRGNISYVKLSITVKETDLYRCVATQENISHQINAEIPVTISGPEPEKPPGFSTGAVVGAFLGGVLTTCLGGFLYKCYNKQKPKEGKKKDPTAEEMI
ncbi:V-set and immunoglobulin domain-containing protein 1-like isoform X2 [Anoplopoma fimbria]|uniref:V-set and immunoglobulin domain-containing protein 1-like isoform X2 n=1 Tax=Anoplopoma fimbria TaxID=229290 RepID=UPI0023EB98BD|nr:V-set and immunoglobulin domain-containing protein 1-like isoform X2 [Anoplopoma fimbria]